MRLAERIASCTPKTGELAVFYLAQAGFYFKTATGKTLCIDPYLSDYCEKLAGFKRMIPTLMAPQELVVDILATTHLHEDHLDPDLLDVIKLDKRTRFLGAPDCRSILHDAGVEDDRVTILAEGESGTVNGWDIRAIYADHADLAPDAVGYLIDFDGVIVYNTGDTGYRPDEIMASLGDVKIDILIAPINPAYGNLGHDGVVNLAARIKPRVVIGSHFGMFIDHGGDPKAFLEYAKQKLTESIKAVIMAPGERMSYSPSDGVTEMETHREH